VLEYLPHTNPQVDALKVRFRGKRGGSKTGLLPVERYGMRLCAWCAKKPLATHSQKYCSQLCSQSSDAFFYPTKAGYPFLLARQGGQCAGCDLDWEPILIERFQKKIKRCEEAIARTKAKMDQDPERYKGDLMRDEYELEELRAKLENRGLSFWLALGIRHLIPYDQEPQVDHIIPVALGGDGVGLENHQVLCRLCHAKKTKQDNQDIRNAKTANAQRTKGELLGSK